MIKTPEAELRRTLGIPEDWTYIKHEDIGFGYFEKGPYYVEIGPHVSWMMVGHNEFVPHRLDGPAWYTAKGQSQYWVNGYRVPKRNFKKVVREWLVRQTVEE